MYSMSRQYFPPGSSRQVLKGAVHCVPVEQPEGGYLQRISRRIAGGVFGAISRQGDFDRS